MRSKIPIPLNTHTLHHRPHYTPTLKRKRNTRRWGMAILPDEKMQHLVTLIQEPKPTTRLSTNSTEHSNSEIMLDLMEMLDIEIAERTGETTLENPKFDEDIYYISKMIKGSLRVGNIAALGAYKHMLKAEKAAAKIDIEAMALSAIEFMDTEAMDALSSTVDLLEDGKLGIS